MIGSYVKIKRKANWRNVAKGTVHIRRISLISFFLFVVSQRNRGSEENSGREKKKKYTAWVSGKYEKDSCMWVSQGC